MRINRLDLHRYGKFTDCSLTLPAAPCDFHMLVGANEAGKSTIRAAILDLLFGIEARSTYDFLHPRSELRLAGSITHAADSLDFQRLRKSSKSLLDAAGQPLGDDALLPFLGNSERSFFDQMFALDHLRLIRGGNEILNASNDIGRILFQSAAGIGSLGAVRDQLEAEADKLWARRHARDRAYYAAKDELAVAEAELKRATMRTRDWLDASGKVQALQDRMAGLQDQVRALETERAALERVRRVAPSVRAHQGSQQELAALGEVIQLPADAGASLAAAEREMASATTRQKLLVERAGQLQALLATIVLDDAVLACAADITALAERRQQTRFHTRDIDKRQQEVKVHWQDIEACVRQLGWPAGDEDHLASRLPPAPVRSSLAALARRHATLELALAAATDAAHQKAREVEAIEADLAALPTLVISPSLRAALETALRLGDFRAAQQREEGRVAKAERELHQAESRLGAWKTDLSPPGQLALPAAAQAERLLRRATENEAAQTALRQRALEVAAEIESLELATTQFRRTHDPVTSGQVANARHVRDAVWTAIRSGGSALTDSAAIYEEHVETADQLADQRHAKAHEAAELQAKLDDAERRQRQAEQIAERLRALADEAATIDSEWAAQAAALGVPTLPLAAFEGWQEARAATLRAADAALQARAEQQQTADAVARAQAALRAAIADAGVALPSDLEALILAARHLVDEAAATATRRAELTRQLAATKSASADLARRRDAADAALADWQERWQQGLRSAGLAGDTDVATLEGTLKLFDDIDDKRQAIRELRQARIAAMQKDLDDFRSECRRLADLLAPAMVGESPDETARRLNARLLQARDDAREAARLTGEIARAGEQIAEVAGAIDTARAAVDPLLRLARATSHADLHAAVTRSDTARALSLSAAAARRAAEEAGDGLPLAALAAAVDATDMTQVTVRLAEIARQLASERELQVTLAAELATAGTSLARIAGQDDAARAEAARQQALASMADAAERFIQVHTAGRLLRWAIDRYRETRQGPMLARAGEIFCRLTLGSFAKLTVDFEARPPLLEGLRADGRTVGISGMSEGTRDQLYLALRLAALEMHISQARALPFIADDLFINYDDVRARAGIEALAELSATTQVVFLSHHPHLVPAVREVFGDAANVVMLGG